MPVNGRQAVLKTVGRCRASRVRFLHLPPLLTRQASDTARRGSTPRLSAMDARRIRTGAVRSKRVVFGLSEFDSLGIHQSRASDGNRYTSGPQKAGHIGSKPISRTMPA